MRFAACRFVVIGILSLSLFGSRSVLADATTSPGKQSVFRSQSLITLTGTDTRLIGAEIVKGKRRRVLSVDVQMGGTTNGASMIPRIYVLVNGEIMEPTAGAGFWTPSATCQGAYCNLVGTFWLDLDVAEAVNPGQFIKQPLVIDVWGFDNDGNTREVSEVTMRAELVKK